MSRRGKISNKPYKYAQVKSETAAILDANMKLDQLVLDVARVKTEIVVSKYPHLETPNWFNNGGDKEIDGKEQKSFRLHSFSIGYLLEVQTRIKHQKNLSTSAS